MKNLIILLLVVGLWRVFPEGKKVEIVYDVGIFPVIDTVTAKHWHRAGERVYIVTIDNKEIWCDIVEEL